MRTTGGGNETSGFLSGSTSKRRSTLCLPTVIVMQATKDGEGDDLSRLLQVIWLVWLARDTLLDALVGTGVIEVGLILLHGSIEMAFA